MANTKGASTNLCVENVIRDFSPLSLLDCPTTELTVLMDDNEATGAARFQRRAPALQKVDIKGLFCISLIFLAPEAPKDGKPQVQVKFACVCTDTREFGFNFRFPTFGASGVDEDETRMLERLCGDVRRRPCGRQPRTVSVLARRGTALLVSLSH